MPTSIPIPVALSPAKSAAGSVRAPVRVLPPLAAADRSDLTPAQRRAVVASMVLLHLAAGYGLLQIGAVREAVMQTAPLFVDILTSPAPVPPAPPPPPRPLPAPNVRQTAPVIAAAPSPAAAPAAFTVAPPPAEPAPQAAVAVEAPPVPAPAVAPPPRVIPASAVQFLVSPDVVYPRLSRRNGESGLVLVRAYIDAAGGPPRSVTVDKSSGFARLDEAAVSAVNKARFKPHTQNGQPVEGWTVIPIHYELEKQ